jgi:cell fate regulator YaaT (PSP1 superfamily)
VPLLIEVAFKGNRKEFFLWEPDEAPPRAAAVIVDADRGEDLGRVHTVGDEAAHRAATVPHGLTAAPVTRPAKRLATSDDVRRYDEVRAGDDEARRRAAERVRANALVMKLTDAEWQWDRKKLTFYFTAEKRVDFRTLVRELASMFRTRIELKQIGVRDEAKRLDGIGRCGRQYCSASWLPELRPVNLGVAKDQRLSLNPSQISGACGRLMCCLRYEHDFYVESRRRYPKETKVVRTSRGEEKVVANDIFRERVTLRGVDGEMRTIGLADLRGEMLAAGDVLAAALETAALETAALERPLVPASPDGEELIELTELAPESSGRPEQRPRPPRPRAEPAATATVGQENAMPAAPAESTAPDGERRAQRRRGRRGGRRNRPGGSGPATRDGEQDADQSGDAS